VTDAEQEDEVGLHPLAVRFHHRVVAVVATLAALAVAAAGIGVTGAAAQQTEGDPEAAAEPTQGTLLERLDALEALLPDTAPPTDVTLDAETTWGTLAGDAGSARAVLDTLEGDLRRLFVDADDAEGEVADAVALVARGWLDVWQGAGALATWEANDLAFPIDTVDDDAVATGADELRGQAEKGLELVLLGRARHLEGYVALRELGEAEPAAQARLDARAGEAETFDAEVRPLVVRMLSQRTTNVLVPVERFGSTAPGVEARARSLEVACVDRDALAEAGVAVDDEVVAELEAATPERADCPDLPEPAEAP
jgi:hypothetical protein